MFAEMERQENLKYHTLIATFKNVGLNVKEYFTYVFGRLIDGENNFVKPN